MLNHKLLHLKYLILESQVIFLHISHLPPEHLILTLDPIISNECLLIGPVLIFDDIMVDLGVLWCFQWRSLDSFIELQSFI